MSRTNWTCCGGELHENLPEYKCCADLYYIRVPPGQICCSSDKSTEISSTIGYGNTCCENTPYYNDSLVQKCCVDQIIPDKLLMVHPVITFDFNTCISPKPIFSGETVCEKFELVFLTSDLKFIDSSLKPYRSYDYKICANNTFGTACNAAVFSMETAMDLPTNFSYFDYSLSKSSIVFNWNTPIFANGPITSYRLLKNNYLVYEGLELYYVEALTQLLPYRAYKYEVRFFKLTLHALLYNR